MYAHSMHAFLLNDHYPATTHEAIFHRAKMFLSDKWATHFWMDCLACKYYFTCSVTCGMQVILRCGYNLMQYSKRNQKNYTLPVGENSNPLYSRENWISVRTSREVLPGAVNSNKQEISRSWLLFWVLRGKIVDLQVLKLYRLVASSGLHFWAIPVLEVHPPVFCGCGLLTLINMVSLSSLCENPPVYDMRGKPRRP